MSDQIHDFGQGFGLTSAVLKEGDGAVLLGEVGRLEAVLVLEPASDLAGLSRVATATGWILRVDHEQEEAEDNQQGCPAPPRTR